MYLTQKKYWPILITIDSIGWALFFWKQLRKAPTPKEIRKVLFIRLEHIGDMIMATPTFETFKKNNPRCEVHVLCRDLTKPLIQYNKNIDKIITYDAPWFAKRAGDKKESFMKIIKQIRKEQYDIVFEMHGELCNNIIAGLSKAYVVGYSCRGGGFFVNKNNSYDPNISTIDQNMKLITAYSTKKYKETKIYINDVAKKEGNALLKKYNLQTKEFIIINPQSGRKEKDLSIMEVKKLIRTYKETIVITGSESEKNWNEQFTAKNVINLSGKTTLLGLVELTRNAKKVIAPDTGIVHIAHAVHTPCNAIYKTTNKKQWGYT